ncbi:MAG: motility associated factor glycosyltransferase family protein [Deltaproteobacteria bacterium]|nr:motility associated factor glycosyltransferase family protein [Deltaproteobacteria bacterium]
MLKANHDILRLKNPELLLLLESGGFEPVVIESSKSGAPTFKYRGIYFHSLYDPAAEAKRLSAEIVSKRADWVILFGLGCGHIAQRLIEEKIERLIIHEPSLDILKAVLSKVDLSDILSKDAVYLTHTMPELTALLRDKLDGMDDIAVSKTAPYQQVFAEEHVMFINQVGNVHMTGRIGIQTDIVSRRDWIKNYFANIPSMRACQPIDIFKNRYKHVPLVIVGAGPSLEKNVHLLKDMKGRALILASVSAYKPLLLRGISPDFVIASEKVDLPEYFTEDDTNIRLILGEVSHPNMFRDRKVRNTFIYYNMLLQLSIEQARFWGSSYFPLCGGSVTTMAFDMGFMFGCDPIVFIGQDLAYGENKTHVSGSVYGRQELVFDPEKGVIVKEAYIKRQETQVSAYDLYWIKGQDNKLLASRYDWVTFHQWFEDYMKKTRKNGVVTRVINSTEGGAYIDGMEHRPLQDVIAWFIDFNAPCFVEDLIIDAEADGRRTVDIPALVKSFSTHRLSLEHIRRYAKRILGKAKALKRGLAAGGLDPSLEKDLKEIKTFEEKLFKETENIPFIWEAMVQRTYRIREYLKEDLLKDDLKQFRNDLETTEGIYEDIIAVCDECEPLVEGALKDLEGG